MIKSETELAEFVQNSPQMMEVLKVARSANLVEWLIGAGFLRNTIWSVQHGFEPEYKFRDIDLVYFDKTNPSEKADAQISQQLQQQYGAEWEVVNQAYAHKYDADRPYASAVDGLAHWIETATCVGVTLDNNDKVKVLAPYGVDDLLNLKIRLAPVHSGNQYYVDRFYERIKEKRWLEKWPQLVVVDPVGVK